MTEARLAELREAVEEASQFFDFSGASDPTVGRLLDIAFGYGAVCWTERLEREELDELIEYCAEIEAEQTRQDERTEWLGDLLDIAYFNPN